MDGNHRLYRDLIEPIENQMIRSVWRIVQDPDDFDDAFQDALTTVWRRLNRIQRHPNPQALILRICVNAAYDVLRRQARIRRREAPEAIPEALPDPAPSAAEQASIQQERDEILRAIAQLPRKQAQAALMRFVQELSYRDIAQALGCGESTARTHVMRARTRLAKILAHLAPKPRKEAAR
jgi:RNA polymerase sigma-70 factor (ECF subfamily)